MDDGETLSERLGVVLFLTVTILLLLFVGSCSFKKCCKGFRSLVCCCCCKPSTEDTEHAQHQNPRQDYYEDSLVAHALQRRINEEERQLDRLAKRKERRMWYDYYMKPFTMVVEKSDLFRGQLENLATTDEVQCTRAEDGTIMVQTNTQLNSKDSDEVDSDIEELSDSNKQLGLQCTVCDDEDAPLCLKIPATGVCVDGTCALCIDEYETGDEVVWSNLQCPHVFHKACLMEWLSKGKKRCPICRNWFVPGSKIDDQKLMHGEAWNNALAEMEDLENQKNEIKAQNEAQLETHTEKVTASQDIATDKSSELYHRKPEDDNLGSNTNPDDANDNASRDVGNNHSIKSEECIEDEYNML